MAGAPRVDTRSVADRIRRGLWANARASENSADFPYLCVVVPTRNEAPNIQPLLARLVAALGSSGFTAEIVIVDDSNDETPRTVRREAARLPLPVRMIHREATQRTGGLGGAVLAGAAMTRAEWIVVMDGDLQHPPEIAPELVKAGRHRALDLVVASRYRETTTADGLGSRSRVGVSRLATQLARAVFPKRLADVTDPMSGFFAIRRPVLARAAQRMQPNGFKILLETIAASDRLNIGEVSYDFGKRHAGESKASLAEGIRFVRRLAQLRMRPTTTALRFGGQTAIAFTIGVLTALVAARITPEAVTTETLIRTGLTVAIAAISVTLLAQALFSLYLTLHAWDDPEPDAPDATQKHGAAAPSTSFTILLPARHEEKVIDATIARIGAANYPAELLEVVVVCHEDDTGTIAVAARALKKLDAASARVETFGGRHMSKPKGLNVGMARTRHDVIAVFDAEDDVHPEIFRVADDRLRDPSVSVVQGGVQLTNFRDNWFSVHNCLEYYFWFRSRLHFHAEAGAIPLGGNTVFMRRAALEEVGGWDEDCLTEDADVGIRLSALGGRTVVVYDPEFVTREETPDTLGALIRQRTRWNQGFMQVLRKGDWRRLPERRQRWVLLATLLQPICDAAAFAVLPLCILALLLRLPLPVAILSLLPIYVVFLQAILSAAGSVMFCRAFGFRMPPLMPFRVFLTHLPYQMVLIGSAFRAGIRELRRRKDWEKTDHTGAHRLEPDLVTVPVRVGK